MTESNELYKNTHFKELANNLATRFDFYLEYQKFSNKIHIFRKQKAIINVRDWEDAYNFLRGYEEACGLATLELVGQAGGRGWSDD